MKRRILIGLAGLAGTILMAIAALAYWSSTPIDVPYPDVTADRSAAGVERGRVLFEGTCGACHVGPGSTHAAGAPMTEVPPFLGSFHSRNLTRDRIVGIGALPDRAITRLVRYGVTHDGRAAVMPTYGFSDEDLAAVLGFLRSDDPLFDADATPSPASRPTLAGRVLVRAGLADAASRPASGLRAPPRGPTVEYGRYLAHDVYDCAGCHTPGYDPDKTHGAELLSGGFEFATPSGETVRAPNLTRHANGIGGWTEQDLSRVLRDGVKPDGRAIRLPMPRFRGLGADEVAALDAYLRSVPALAGEVPATRVPTRAATAPAPTGTTVD